MHIEINDHTRLSEIAAVFNSYYPFLKITFFHGVHGIYQSSPDDQEIAGNATIGEIKRTHISTLIEIQPWYKVKEVEREFQDRLGISVQIMKKENDHWDQSTGLDMLSIKDLNLMSRNSSDEFIVTDYDETMDEEFER